MNYVLCRGHHQYLEGAIRNMINICTKCGFDSLIISGTYSGHDRRWTTDDGQWTTPGVWHKLPTGELKINV